MGIYKINKTKEHKRICKYCEEIYSTNAKHSKVCPSCYEKNHKEKVKRNLFNNGKTG